jgi:MFS family permease
MKKPSQKPFYKWTILILGCLTNALVVAVQGMGVSVLLPEITNDLNLSLVQAGLIWGMASLPSILSFIIAGSIIDKWGPKRVLIIACLLVGLIGASRGLAVNFSTLLITVFLFGFFSPFIPLSNIKNVGLWFEDETFGTANGILSLGMALGFFAGSMVSASFISPWLGGWRYTLIFYGLIGLLFAIPWLFTQSNYDPSNQQDSEKQTIWGGMKHIFSVRNVWLLGFALLGYNGAVQGFLGYVPLFLRNIGWQEVRADSLAATFHLASLFFTIPLAFLSDKIASRKRLVIAAASLTALGIGLFFVLEGNLLWGAVIAAGLGRDGIMAILFTMVLETRGIGKLYSGIATGFVMIFGSIGALLAPPAGNTLASVSPETPFLFWAGLCVLGVVSIILIAESGMLRKAQPVNTGQS